MKYENFFKDIFESIPDYKKVVLLIFLIQNDKILLREVGFSERDINHLNLQFKNKSIEEHDKYLDYIKTEEESVIEKFFE